MAVLRERNYEAAYFFNAHILHRSELTYIELIKIFRQKDQSFTQLLNQIRMNQDARTAIQIMNESCYHPNMGGDHQAITLTTTNQRADSINAKEMRMLDTETRVYKGRIDGKFNVDERNLPSPLDLTLKLGARVMFTANDRNIPRRWMNGTLGKVVQFETDAVTVELDVSTHATSKLRHLVEVPIYAWESYQYEYDEKEQQIKPVVNGKFEQFPLMLAWAVTIHKSQGKTLEKVRVDLTGGSFAPGQVYVALSRCTTLEGIELLQPIKNNDVRTDAHVIDFYRRL
jgi:ATP-dependent exoDNAse (exonuclease V) alpha subunit